MEWSADDSQLSNTSLIESNSTPNASWFAIGANKTSSDPSLTPNSTITCMHLDRVVQEPLTFSVDMDAFLSMGGRRSSGGVVVREMSEEGEPVVEMTAMCVLDGEERWDIKTS